MIDPATLTKADIGKLVRYIPLHGETETGTNSRSFGLVAVPVVLPP